MTPLVKARELRATQFVQLLRASVFGVVIEEPELCGLERWVRRADSHAADRSLMRDDRTNGTTSFIFAILATIVYALQHDLPWPVPSRRDVTPLAFEGVGGVVLRGAACGTGQSGPPLLLVHGLASNARMWSGAARELEARGHRTVAMDLRGHGASDKPDRGYDFPTMVEDLRLVLDALAARDDDWRRAVVVGQSMGGNLVLELAAAHPHALAAVVGVDGGMIELRETFANWDDCERELAPPDLTDRTPDELRAMLRAGSEDWPEEGIDGMMACFGVSAAGTVVPHLTRERHLLLLRELWERPPSRLYAGVTVPVLLLPADGTRQVPFSNNKRRDVQRALDALPRGCARWFSPADHDIHAQQPAALAEVLHDAIAEGFLA